MLLAEDITLGLYTFPMLKALETSDKDLFVGELETEDSWVQFNETFFL